MIYAALTLSVGALVLARKPALRRTLTDWRSWRQAIGHAWAVMATAYRNHKTDYYLRGGR